MKKLCIQFLLTLLPFYSVLNATELDSDQFAALNGWSGAGVSLSSGWMKIERDTTATKTYNLGISYAKQSVIIEFTFNVPSDWETSGDVLNVSVNDKLSQSYYNGGGTQTKLFAALVDSTGNLKLAFNPDTSTSSEVAYIDNITISTELEGIREGGREFVIRNPKDTRTVIGDIAVVGNTVQCLTDNTSGFIGHVCDTTPNINAVSNDYMTKYIDTDSNASTFNSSQATLDLPVGATIKWAGLYWQGFMHACQTYGSGEGYADRCRYRNPAISINGTGGVTDDFIDLASTSWDTDIVYIDSPNITGSYTKIEAVSVDYIDNSTAEGTPYMAFADITSDINVTNPSGTYTVANVQSIEGRHGFGNFAAWALFVIYEDLNGQTHSTNVYDGFLSLRYNSFDLYLDGFLTPANGPVDSRTILFSGEGENTYTDNSVSIDGNAISNANNPANNVFNSTLSGFTANPSYTNTNGVDIDDFNTSTYFTNDQTSTTVTVASEIDAIYPSTLGLSVQLFQPYVCFDQTFYREDGQEITATTQPKVYEKVKVVVTVKNDDNETAEQVTVSKVFDEAKFKYVTSSTKIQNVSEASLTDMTDPLDADNANYDDTNKQLDLHLGTGATSTVGGTFEPFSKTSDQAIFEYQGTVQDDNVSVKYTFSYFNPITGESYDNLPLPSCTGSDAYFGAIWGTTIGPFNVTHDGAAVTAPHPITSTGNDKGALYTQVVDTPFNVDIIALEATDFTTPENYNGIVKVDIYDKTNPSDINYTTYVIFDDESSTDLDDVIVQKAYRGAKFEISYIEHPSQLDKDLNPAALDFNIRGAQSLEAWTQSAVPGASCPTNTAQECFESAAMIRGDRPADSRDDFAVRPDRFHFDMTTISPNHATTKLKSGETYEVSTFAYTGAAIPVPSPNYTQARAQLGVTAITRRPAGTVDSTLAGTASFPNDFSFTDGSATTTPLNFTFNDVGLITLDINDTNWTSVDIDDTPMADRIIEGDRNVTFIPWDFNISSPVLKNANEATGFTYFSNDLNMSAKIPMTIRAQRKPGSSGPADLKTLNYADTLYEKDITMTLQVSGIGGLAPVTLGVVAQDLNFAAGEKALTTADADVMKFNFARQTNNPLNPITVTGADVNATVIDTDDVNGTATENADENATFYYGRLHAPRTRIAGNAGNANFYYEIYCFGTDTAGTVCDTTLRDNISGGLLSEDDIRWFQNTNHTSADGNITLTEQKNGDAHISEVTINNATITTIQYTYNGTQGYPYKMTMQIDNSSWLLWNRFVPDPLLQNEFELEFNRVGNWGGTDKSNVNVDSNASTNTSRRIQW